MPLCKNIFGFVAKLCQASYKSNAKTTYRTRPPEHPHRRSRESGNPGHGRFPSPFALSLSKGPPPPAAPAGPLPPASFLRRQESRGAGRGTPPSTLIAFPTPPYPAVWAFRETPVPPQRDSHPDTSPWRPSQRPRYPSPMQHACNDLNQDIASASAPWRSSPAPRMSTIASASASENRRLFRTGAKVENRSL